MGGCEPIIDIRNATVRFNRTSQQVNNLKEYVIKMIKRELMFQEFFALRDISLTIGRGESWGIIGTNGAGKSTLLKLICGILKPYEGSVRVNGRIAPLIELGAGFDEEMTAKENVVLNGTLMGYPESMMIERFQEIIDFAELWDFLDMPIKNYSSGMAARLGFSVATLVHPEILICDEVLSVGDYKFQKKCEVRMKEMLGGGTTLLYVSHNIESVVELCDYAVWLEKGRIIARGDAEEICEQYMGEEQAEDGQ